MVRFGLMKLYEEGGQFWIREKLKKQEEKKKFLDVRGKYNCERNMH